MREPTPKTWPWLMTWVGASVAFLASPMVWHEGERPPPVAHERFVQGMANDPIALEVTPTPLPVRIVQWRRVPPEVTSDYVATPTATPTPSPTPVPPPPTPTPAPVSQWIQPYSIGAGVERWRGLVAGYWPAEQVNNALAVMNCESGGNPNVTGAAGEWGLFQIHPVHVARFGGANPYDPGTNVAVAYQIWSEQGWGPWSCKRVLG